MKSGGKNGQGHGHRPISRKSYTQISFKNGRLFIAENPDKSLRLVEPNPKDPSFLALCEEVEATLGVTIENNPENPKPTYFFGSQCNPSEASSNSSVDHQGQVQIRKSEEVSKWQPQKQKSEKIIRVNKGLNNITVISPEDSPEKKLKKKKRRKRRSNADPDHKQVTGSNLAEPIVISKVEDPGEAGAVSPLKHKSPDVKKPEPDELDHSDSSDFKTRPVKLEIKKEQKEWKSVQVQTLAFDQVMKDDTAEVTSTSPCTPVKRISLTEETVTLVSSSNISCKNEKEKMIVGKINFSSPSEILTGPVLEVTAVPIFDPENSCLAVHYYKSKDSGESAKDDEVTELTIDEDESDIECENEGNDASSGDSPNTTEIETVSSGTSHDNEVEVLKSVVTTPSPTFNAERKMDSFKTKEILMKKMIEDIKKEMQQPNPNMLDIKKWMEDTYPHRKKMIKAESAAYEILKVYPALKYPVVIQQEYFVVCQKHIGQLSAKLDPAIRILFQNEGVHLKKRSKLLQASVKEFTDMKHGLERHHVEMFHKNVHMLAFCTRHIGPLQHGILFSDIRKPDFEIPNMAPFIVLTKGSLVGVNDATSMDIYVEKIKVTTTDSFYDAVLTVYMLYWILWMEYHPISKPIFDTFDELLASSPSNTGARVSNSNHSSSYIH